MTLASILIFSIIIFWFLYIGCLGYCYYKYRTRNDKVVKNEVIEVLQAKIDEFLNNAYIRQHCSSELEYIYINNIEYRCTIIVDLDAAKEFERIEIKLKRE